MQGLRTTIYAVPDLQAATTWYASAFQCQPYFTEVFYVGFNIGGYELGLLPEEGIPIKRGDNVLCYWGVDDIHVSYDHLISLGARMHEAPHNVGGEIMVATVYDPWDNIIGIIYNPEFKLST